MKNPKTKEKCNIKWMIIAYKHPMNLGNLLSHRDLATVPLSCHIYMIRDLGGLCVCVCLVCVFSVCVCVCISLRCANHANTIRVSHASQKMHASHKNPCLTQKSMPNTISLSYSTTVLFCRTNPRMTKTTFDFPL